MDITRDAIGQGELFAVCTGDTLEQTTQSEAQSRMQG